MSNKAAGSKKRDMKPSTSSAEGRWTQAHLSRSRPREIPSPEAMLCSPINPPWCFTSGNLVSSPSGSPTQTPLGTTEIGRVVTQGATGGVNSGDPKRPQGMPPSASSLPPRYPQAPWAAACLCGDRDVENKVMQCKQRAEEQQNLFLPQLSDADSRDGRPALLCGHSLHRLSNRTQPGVGLLPQR